MIDSDTYGSDGHSIWENLTTAPQFDKDPFGVNQIGHPYQGSIYYGFARSAGLSYWESLGYTFAERNIRLPEAKALVQKALSFAPEDPYIADSLAWVEFVQKAHEHLTKRGRKMLVWAEFPLLPEHVKLLPADIIDGEATYMQQEKERGMRQLAYTSMQGAELLFPSHLSLDERRGHLEEALETIRSGRHWQGNPIGSFGAAWDDSGLHNETFWLGWSASARYGWNPGVPALEQHVVAVRARGGVGRGGVQEQVG